MNHGFVVCGACGRGFDLTQSVRCCAEIRCPHCGQESCSFDFVCGGCGLAQVREDVVLCADCGALLCGECTGAAVRMEELLGDAVYWPCCVAAQDQLQAQCQRLPEAPGL